MIADTVWTFPDYLTGMRRSYVYKATWRNGLFDAIRGVEEAGIASFRRSRATPPREVVGKNRRQLQIDTIKNRRETVIY
jgi:hypothetical protein